MVEIGHTQVTSHELVPYNLEAMWPSGHGPQQSTTTEHDPEPNDPLQLHTVHCAPAVWITQVTVEAPDQHVGHVDGGQRLEEVIVGAGVMVDGEAGGG